MKRVNFDALLLDALHEQAQAMKVDWNVVLQADAAARRIATTLINETVGA